MVMYRLDLEDVANTSLGARRFLLLILLVHVNLTPHSASGNSLPCQAFRTSLKTISHPGGKSTPLTSSHSLKGIRLKTHDDAKGARRAVLAVG